MSDRSRPSEPAPGVELTTARLGVGAGSHGVLRVLVTNTADQPRRLLVRALGVDPGWVGSEQRTGVLAPHEATVVEIVVRPAVGTLPAEYPLAVTVQALDAGSGGPVVSPHAVGEAVVVVNPRAALAVEVAPRDSSFVRSTRLRVSVRNDGEHAVPVELSSTTTPGLEVRLPRSVTVAAHTTTAVRGRLVATRPRRFGATVQHSWTVSAASAETVRQAGGSARQRPLLGSGLVKLVTIGLVLAVWVSAALVLIPRLTDRLGPQTDEATTTSATTDGAPAPGAGAGGAGAAPGSAVGPGGKLEVKRTVADSSAEPKGITLTGTVAADQPKDVVVTVATTSVYSRQAAAASAAGTGPTTAAGKLGPAGASSSCSFRTTSVRTDDTGSWALSGVRQPCFYLITFEKLHYTTQSMVIDSTAADVTDPITVRLVAGDGDLRGTVTGATKGAGLGATVTVSDGTSTLTTSASSVDGTFAATQLSTPGTYVVTATKPGYGSTSQQVSLPTAGSVRVSLALSRATTSLTGRITGPGDGAHGSARATTKGGSAQGLGGLDVVVNDGHGNVRTTTTTTSRTAQDPLVGSYVVAGLPVPGTYTVTVSGPGFQTETKKITLTVGGRAPTFDASLQASEGVLTGTVKEGVLQPDGTTVLNAPIEGGAGLVLANADHSYKETTGRGLDYDSTAPGGNDGVFRFEGVAPGTYQLTTTLFSYSPSILSVTVVAGANPKVDPVITRLDGGEVPRTGYASGQVVEADTGAAITCPPAGLPDCVHVTTEVPVAVENSDDTTLQDVTMVPGGDDYKLAGLPPGVYTVTASAPYYESATARVQVGVGKAVVPTISLYKAPVVSGRVTALAGTPSKATTVCAVATGVDAAQACAAATCTVDDDAAFALADPDAAVCEKLTAGVGAYRLTVARHGDYNVVVSPADPEYQDVAATTTSPALVLNPVTKLNLPLGSTVVDNVQLNRLGRVNITAVEATDDSAVLSAAVDATVRLTGSVDPDPRAPDTFVNGVATYTGLRPDTYTVTAVHDDRRAKDPTTVDVGLNQTVTRIVPLVEKVDSLVGQVRSTFRGLGATLGGATVKVTAPTDYTDTTPINGSVTLTSGAGDGCFGVSPSGTIAAPPTGCAFAPGSTAVGQQTFVSSRAEVVVSATGYDTLTTTRRFDAGTVNTFSLDPSFVGFAGTVTAQGGTPDLSKATFSVTQGSTSAPGISVSATAGGALTWNDAAYNGSGSRADKIRPGTYTVTATLEPDYVPASAQLDCPVDTAGTGTTCTLSGLTLAKRGAITVDAVSGTTGAKVSNVIVTLTKDGQTVTKTSATDGSSVTFTGLAPVGGYTVRVQGAGYDFDATQLTCPGATSSITVAPGATTSCTATLALLPKLTGSVSGVLASEADQAGATRRLLAGASVTAMPCTTVAAGVCTAVDTSRTLTGTTNAAGRFTVTGTNQVEGITDGPWLLSAAQKYYDPPATTAPAKPGTLVTVSGADVDTALLLFAQNVDYRVVVNGDGAVQSTATVVLRLGTTTYPGVFQDDAYVFADITPGSYSLDVSSYGFLSKSVQVPVDAENLQSTVTLDRAANTVSGTVRSLAGGTALKDAEVSVLTCKTPTDCIVVKDPAGKTLTAYTDADGAFAFQTVPDGTFTLSASLTGFRTMTATITLLHTNGGAPVLDWRLAAVMRNVQVVVANPDNPSDDLAGTTVTVSPAASDGNGNLAQAPVTLVGTNRTATFTLPYGCWNVVVKLPSTGHYGSVSVPTTSGCQLSVPPDQTASTDLVVNATVAESPLALGVTLDLLTNDQRTGSTATVVVSKQADGGSPVHTNPSVTIGASPATIYVPADTYYVSATPNGTLPALFFTSVTTPAQTPVTVPRSGATSVGVRLHEVASTVTVRIGPGTDGSVTAVPLDAGVTSPGTITTTGSTGTIQLPYGRWALTATRGATTSDTVNLTVSALTATVDLTFPPPAPTP